MEDRPWHHLPPEIAELLRPELEAVANEMMDAVRTVPGYSRPLIGPFGDGVRAGVGEALHHFLAEVERGGPVERPDVYLALGRGEMRAGRSLDALLSAYRVGARVAWRRFAAVGLEAGLEGDTLILLAESLFAYIDMLSAESAEGHSLEQSAIVGELERRRRRLVGLLVRDPVADASEVQAAAADAGWKLPRELAVLAVAGEGSDAVLPRLMADAISDAFGELVCAVIPDPDGPGRRVAVEHAVAGTGAAAALGTTVAWADASISFARARAALALVEDGAPGLVFARDRAGELLLRADPGLAAELAADRLAPLAGLSAGSRTRLTETLRVWLAEHGRLGPVARRLGVHPQTARYRLSRLRELFGSSLDDPDDRFWIELALRTRAVSSPVGDAAQPAAAPGTGRGSDSAGSAATSGPIAPEAISSDQK